MLVKNPNLPYLLVCVWNTAVNYSFWLKYELTNWPNLFWWWLLIVCNIKNLVSLIDLLKPNKSNQKATLEILCKCCSLELLKVIKPAVRIYYSTAFHLRRVYNFVLIFLTAAKSTRRVFLFSLRFLPACLGKTGCIRGNSLIFLLHTRVSVIGVLHDEKKRDFALLCGQRKYGARAGGQHLSLLLEKHCSWLSAHRQGM